jgi:hypothetical protein
VGVEEVAAVQPHQLDGVIGGALLQQASFSTGNVVDEETRN